MADEEPVSQSEVRAWARENDIEVPAHGRIKNEIVEQYRAAQRTVPELTFSATEGPETPFQAADVADAADETEPATEAVSEPDPPAEPEGEPDSDLQWIQTALGVEPSGRLDDATIAAVQAYQVARGLPTTDGPDVLTWRYLLVNNHVTIQTLENGFIHAQRATMTDEVQARLAARGLFDGPAHGLADERTQYAYANYQVSLGLAGTGIPERDSLEQMGFRVSD